MGLPVVFSAIGVIFIALAILPYWNPPRPNTEDSILFAVLMILVIGSGSILLYCIGIPKTT